MQANNNIYLYLGLKLNKIGYFGWFNIDFGQISNFLLFFDIFTSNPLISVTIAAFVCANPNFMPGQIRGPSPNGKNAAFNPFLRPSFVKRSGMNFSGSVKEFGFLQKINKYS